MLPQPCKHRLVPSQNFRTSMAPLSLQELHQKRAQKASETKHSAEELVLVKESRRVPKKKPGAKPASARNVSPAGSLTKANNAGESLWCAPKLWE